MRSITWVAVTSIVILGAFSAAISATAGEKEEKTTIDKVPAVVKAAIEKATAGGKVKKIEKEQYDGKVVYDVDYVKDGEEKEINVAEDGTIVTSAKKEDEDDDK